MRDYHFVIKDGYADGILPDGTHFLIDADMIPTVEQYGFYRSHKGYPFVPKFVTKTNNIYLHWLVLGYTKRPDFQIDHANRIKTDCRRCNLRPVTNQQNTMNRKLSKRNKSGYTGAFYINRKCGGYYVGKICINDKRITLHRSQDVIECAQAYNIASNCKRKDMIGIPWKLAFALRDAGWYLRQDIIWMKPNVMPEPVKDRCTKSYEHIFLLAKSDAYYFNGEAIREPCSESSLADFQRRKTLNNKGGGKDSYEGVRPDLCRSRADYYGKDGMRNARDVWQINTKPYRGAHFATFPEELANRCIAAGCPDGGLVLDPFMGAGTTAVAAKHQEKHYIGIDLNPAYVELAEKRISESR